MTQKTKLYRVTEFVGRWSMIDVFVVGILVALIQNRALRMGKQHSADLGVADYFRHAVLSGQFPADYLQPVPG